MTMMLRAKAQEEDETYLLGPEDLFQLDQSFTHLLQTLALISNP